jgi:hypothetical protein
MTTVPGQASSHMLGVLDDINNTPILCESLGLAKCP